MYELAPVPASLFDEYGDMRKGTKSILVTKLACDALSSLPEVDLEIVDGNQALYHVSWPKMGALQHFKETFCHSFSKLHGAYVIFDKYVSGSIKSHDRRRHDGGSTPQHHILTCDSPLPPQDIIMNSDFNKRQLIKVLCNRDEGNHLSNW